MPDFQASPSNPSSGLSPARAVVFDLDDTLYAERDYVRSGYRAVEGYLLSRTGRKEPFATWLWQRFLAGRTANAFDDLLVHFSLNVPADEVGELVRLYREHKPTIRPYDGMIEFLGRLREKCCVGLLTDGLVPAQRVKVEALRIERFFDAIVYTEELGRDAWKPSSRGFEAIRERLGVEHAACAYVADNPAKDFVAPNRLGWRTIRLLRPLQVHAHRPACQGGQPRFIARDPQEVMRALTVPTGAAPS